MFSDNIIGAIRTFVPLAIGWLLTTLAVNAEFVLDETTAEALKLASVGIVSAAYWTIVRLLASKWEWMGVFLGYNKKPAYATIAEDGAVVRYDWLGNAA